MSADARIEELGLELPPAPSPGGVYVPIVITGFEPLDILQGIFMCIRQLEAGRHEVENQYSRSVRAEGNQAAIQQVRDVFQPVPRKWRGIGEIPASGLALREPYVEYDAERRFDVMQIASEEPAECLAGEVLQGHKRPYECLAFGQRCTPDSPLGAPMVSAEGACAAYYRYRYRRPGKPVSNHPTSRTT